MFADLITFWQPTREMAFRLDIGTLRPPQRMADGRIRVDGYLTRIGVFEYRQPDGSIRREYRPADEVFKADAMQSFAMVPVTDDHPPESLSARNARQFAVGTVGEVVRQDGEHVAATLVVYDEATIKKMDSGKVQLSCGYEVDVEDAPGVAPDGTRYDAVQRNIRGNHVALVDVGRAGPSARVRMDAAVMVEDNGDDRQDAKDSLIMDELKKALARVAELEAKCDALDKECAEHKARADKADAERDNAKAEAIAAERARQDAADAFAGQVRARVGLETRAAGVLGSEFKLDSLTDREIKCAVVKHLDGVEIPADKSDDYVAARFDAAMERADKSSDALANLRRATDDARQDATVTDEDAAYRAMVARNAKRWNDARKGN